MDDIYLKEESYKIIGKGHSEVVYKDALELEYEFKINSIPFGREKIMKLNIKILFYLENMLLILLFITK